MTKKVVFIIFAIALLAFGSGIAQAVQVDGMTSNGLPSGLPGSAFVTTSINPGGLGDSLIYGYYNVRETLNIINLTNTSTTDGVKARVIFRNGKNSLEVLDFSVCLSLTDTWRGFLIDSAGGAVLYDDGAFTAFTGITGDTITAPTIPGLPDGAPFKSYTTRGVTVSVDDTREGYFEVVGLTRIPFYDKNASSTDDCTIDTTEPQNCIRTAQQCEDYHPADSTDYDVPNVLTGKNDIIDFNTLTSFAYNATAVADTTDTSFSAPSLIEPTITFAMDSRTDRDITFSGCNEFEYILTKKNAMYTYDLEKGLDGQTEFIFTFPTRLACHLDNVTENTNLFNGTLRSDSDTVYASYCTNVTPTIYDWREKTQASPLDFSPKESLTFCLANEVNVVQLGTSKIWNTQLAPAGLLKHLDNAKFPLGWINFDLEAADAAHVSVADTFSSFGLPVLVSATQTLLKSSGHMLPMNYNTRITTD